MLLAPRPKAAMSVGAFGTSSAWMNRKKRIVTPSSPRPATVKPITAPPRNARLSAAATPPVRAASVVRAFAAVAIRMPMKPALPEAIAPAR